MKVTVAMDLATRLLVDIEHVKSFWFFERWVPFFGYRESLFDLGYTIRQAREYLEYSHAGTEDLVSIQSALGIAETFYQERIK